MPTQVVFFGVMVALLVVVQIVGHALLAIVDRSPESDERGLTIALLGARNGGFALATGVFLSLCVALVTEGNFLFTHVLLASWVAAELVGITTQLILFRRGS